MKCVTKLHYIKSNQIIEVKWLPSLGVVLLLLVLLGGAAFPLSFFSVVFLRRSSSVFLVLLWRTATWWRKRSDWGMRVGPYECLKVETPVEVLTTEALRGIPPWRGGLARGKTGYMQ